MDQYQKEQVLALRRNGETCAKIAGQLDLSVNTVKSFCRRNMDTKPKENRAKEKSETTATTARGGDRCPQCGNKITRVSKRKPKKFCSDECRVKWWNSHAENVKRKALYTFQCAHCGKDFTAYGNAKRRYCSHACYCDDRFNRSPDDGKAATV